MSLISAGTGADDEWDGAAAALLTALPESTTAATAAPTTMAPSTTAPPPAATTTTVRSTIRVPIGLPADSAVIASHQGQLIWNRTATNVTHENVTWWLSQVFARSEAPGGWISVDLEALTVSGVISESWKCANNCQNERWSVLDTGWAATIVDGALEPDGAGWLVSGTVDIRYHAEGGYRETGQAVCGGTCEFKDIGSATVPLRGVVIGGQVELQFADGFVGYLADMDFTGLEKTPFWMSRFSQTWNVDLG